MLGGRTQYFNSPFQGHIAQECSFINSQIKGVRNLAVYSCFHANQASFSKSSKTKESYIELFNIL